jgi:hypothetical protein
MSKSKMAWRMASWPILAMGFAAPLLTNCGGMPAMPAGAPGGDLAGGGCPDVSSVEAMEKFDFVGGFKLQGEEAGKLKAGLGAAIELKSFAGSVDSDLKTGCGGLAKDLGATGDFATGEDACKAAVKAMGDVKAKMGASAKIAIDIKPPECRASMDAYADCAGHCDVNVKPGEAKVECEPGKLSGTCGAQCSGTCDFSASAKCDGTCAGTCDATMKGSCGGKCNGKCDGKPANGVSCTGTCDGKCDAHVEGTCSGSCGGSCKMKAGGSCKGTCSGSCTTTMEAPKCTGEMKPPQMSADCKAKCDARVQAKAECSPASVGIRIEGAADAKAAETYKAALEKNLPLVLKVAIGVGERGVKMAGNVAVVVDGAKAGVEASAKASPLSGGKLVGCVAAPFKGAIDAAASLKASVSVSVDVKASASASGSASGKAG